MTKMTKKDYFEKIKGIVADDAELVEFIDRQIELATKKRTGETKTQKENKELVEKIYEFIVEVNGPVTVNDVQERFELTSGQKASALLKKLVDAGRIERAKDGKKAIYTIAD